MLLNYGINQNETKRPITSQNQPKPAITTQNYTEGSKTWQIASSRTTFCRAFFLPVHEGWERKTKKTEVMLSTLLDKEQVICFPFHFFSLLFTPSCTKRRIEGETTRGSCPSLNESKQVWRPFFGNFAALIKNGKQVKKLLKPRG